MSLYRNRSAFLNLAEGGPSVAESQTEQPATRPQCREIPGQLAPPIVLVVTSARDVRK